MSNAETGCPVCCLANAQRFSNPDSVSCYCERCGSFELTRTGLAVLGAPESQSQLFRAALSYSIRKSQRHTQRPLIHSNTVTAIRANPRLPSIMEAAQNLVIWFGETLAAPGETIDVSPTSILGIAGLLNESAFWQVSDHLIEEGLIEGQTKTHLAHATLSLKGWQLFEGLRTGAYDGGH